jgi:hypothetical protein
MIRSGEPYAYLLSYVTGAYTLDKLAGDIDGLIDALGYTKVFLVSSIFWRTRTIISAKHRSVKTRYFCG